MKIGFVKLATAKSMKIGELVYHNPVFLVAPPRAVLLARSARQELLQNS